MWRYRDRGNPHEKLVRAERHVMVWLAKLGTAEFEYQIEKARRIAKGHKKSSYSEANKLKEIRYCIQQCRTIEKVYNQDSSIKVDKFEDTVFDEAIYAVTREILSKRSTIREYNKIYQRTRRRVDREGKSVLNPNPNLNSSTNNSDILAMKQGIAEMREKILAEAANNTSNKANSNTDSNSTTRKVMEILKGQVK